MGTALVMGTAFSLARGESGSQDATRSVIDGRNVVLRGETRMFLLVCPDHKEYEGVTTISVESASATSQ